MGIKSIFVFFLTLALGYALCVHAKKQKGVLQTLGYTLGIGAIVFTLLFGLFQAQGGCPMHSKYGKMGKMDKMCSPMMMKQCISEKAAK